MAAHITAASPKGPRFDKSLSPAERSSPDNGIWTCTKHGREIDSDKSAWSVDALRGRKRIREDRADREYHQAQNTEDRSIVLVDFQNTTNKYQLFEIVNALPYTYLTTSTLRTLLRNAADPSHVLKLAPEVIIGNWDSSSNASGIMSTLLSNNIDFWRPSHQALAKLEKLCTVAIKSDDWARVALVEPLAFALAAKGRPATHEKLLERLIGTRHWRGEDATRIRAYYEGVGHEIVAIFRHWHDPSRKGLLRVNDVSRLIDILLAKDMDFSVRDWRAQLVNLLIEHVRILSKSGAAELGRQVNELVEGLKLAPSVRSTK